MADTVRKMTKDGDQKMVMFVVRHAGVTVCQISNDNVASAWDVVNGMTFDNQDDAVAFLNGKGWS